MFGMIRSAALIRLKFQWQSFKRTMAAMLAKSHVWYSLMVAMVFQSFQYSSCSFSYSLSCSTVLSVCVHSHMHITTVNSFIVLFSIFPISFHSYSRWWWARRWMDTTANRSRNKFPWLDCRRSVSEKWCVQQQYWFDENCILWCFAWWFDRCSRYEPES